MLIPRQRLRALSRARANVPFGLVVLFASSVGISSASAQTPGATPPALAPPRSGDAQVNASGDVTLAPALNPGAEVAPTRIGLADAIGRALARNPTYQTALLEVDRAGALVEQSRAGWLPTLYGNGAFVHADGARTQGGTVLLSQNELSANLTLTVPLVMARQWLTTAEAKVREDAADASAADVRRMVAYATAQAYLAVYSQKFVIAVDENARETAIRHADYTRQRFAGGVGNRLDEVRAVQEVATDNALLQQAYASLTSAEEALGVLVGVEGPLDTDQQAVLPEPPTLAQGLAGASNRTDVVALDVKRRAADKTVNDDWSDYMPFLVGVALPFYENPATPTIPTTGYQLELLLTVPLYDGGLRYGQHKERASLLDEAKVAYEGGLRQARSDVRAAFEVMRRADDAYASSGDAAKLAAQALELANAAYHAGAVTNIEVIDAERQARDAATQAEIAADAARQARLTMLTASGHFP
jgi:outer membrane protein TolC